MAANVFAAALRNSESEGNDRNVLLALADCAWRDGVTWILVGDDKHDEEETICRLARVSRATVWRSLKQLVAAGEVHTVRVRRGRSFVTVYRVVHGAVDVDYERIPFKLPYRFGEPDPSQGSNLKRSPVRAAASEHSTEPKQATDGQRSNLQRSTTPDVERSTLHDESVQRFNSIPFNVSPSRAHDVNAGTVREPAAEPKPLTADDPAAEQRLVADAAVTEAVRSLPGADFGSPKIVIPLAHGLPAHTFDGILEKVRERRGHVGLLVNLLKIARAERTAILSAQLARELGQQHAPAYVPAPWLIDSLRRDDPERYARIMATNRSFPIELLSEVFHDRDDVDQLLALGHAVRAGSVPAERVGTPEQERMRWVDAHADDPDAHAVIDAWDDVDPIERQALHERIEQRRDDDSTRKAA